MFHSGIDGITSKTLSKLARYEIPVSVCGNLQAFTMVGTAASPSPVAASKMALLGESTKLHTINAITEKAPQLRSKNPNLQTPLRLKNAATTT
jgi:hypothetical protein